MARKLKRKRHPSDKSWGEIKQDIKKYAQFVIEQTKARRLWKPFLIAFLVLYVWTSYFTFSVNMSDSLPGKVFLVYRTDKTLKQGDLVYFKYYGHYYRKGIPFMKIVAGAPGDKVTHNDRDYFVNGKKIAWAKPTDLSGRPLMQSCFSGPVPQGKYWVVTPHKDSLDSRYEDPGMISQGQVIGKAYRIF